MYLGKNEVPKATKEKVMKEGQKHLQDLYAREVLMEQDLATSEKPVKVKQVLKEKGKELKTTVSIREWALFRIGAY